MTFNGEWSILYFTHFSTPISFILILYYYAVTLLFIIRYVVVESNCDIPLVSTIIIHWKIQKLIGDAFYCTKLCRGKTNALSFCQSLWRNARSALTVHEKQIDCSSWARRTDEAKGQFLRSIRAHVKLQKIISARRCIINKTRINMKLIMDWRFQWE